MGYVEVLRLSNGLKICLSILVAIGAFMVLLFAILARGHHLTIDNGDAHGVGISVLIGLAVYPAAGFTTAFAWSLNRASENADVIWTRPISRVRLALTYLGLDAAAIAGVFLFALGLYVVVADTLGSIIGLHKTLTVDRPALPAIVLGIGVCFMWFGLVQAATAFNRGRGGIIAGVSWAVFIILLSLVAIKLEPIHTMISVLNFFNPLAYKDLSGFVDQDMSSFSTSFHSGISVIALGIWYRVALTWTIGAIGCAVAVLGWKRLEL